MGEGEGPAKGPLGLRSGWTLCLRGQESRPSASVMISSMSPIFVSERGNATRTTGQTSRMDPVVRCPLFS